MKCAEYDMQDGFISMGLCGGQKYFRPWKLESHTIHDAALRTGSRFLVQLHPAVGTSAYICARNLISFSFSRTRSTAIPNATLHLIHNLHITSDYGRPTQPPPRPPHNKSFTNLITDDANDRAVPRTTLPAFPAPCHDRGKPRFSLRLALSQVF